MYLKALLFVNIILLLSCGGGGSNSSSEDSSDFVRTSNVSCQAPDFSTDIGDYSFSPAFPNLPMLSQPIAMRQLPNNSLTWILAQREGLIVSFDNDSSANSVNSVLDIRSQVTTEGEFGLSGFAFHPNYPNDNRLFVLYNDSALGGRSTLSSFDVSTQNLQASNEQVLLTLDQPATNHNGGYIAFGPDDYLYVAFGDGGANRESSQDLTVLHGSMLRIDINGRFPYTIPADRGNYGWPIMEANSCFNATSCNTAGLEFPITQYGRSVGVSIVGGYVYRGSEIPALSGQYIFADTFSPSVLSIPSNSSTGSDNITLTTSSLTLGSFAQSNNGEIFALDLASSAVGNAIYRLSSDGESIVTLPESLNATGCFDVTSKTTPVGVIPYQVNSQLWSDGAEKSRLFAVPDGSEIEVNSQGDFIFPVGSVLIKHFITGSQYLETRFMVNLPSGWLGYSYEWNEAQTEALLVDEGGSSIDTQSFTHTIPGRNQCFECHTSAAGFSLGLEASQQNYTANINDRNGQLVSVNFIDYLSQLYLSSPITSMQYTSLVGLDDQSASSNLRARSYLHSNCSNCHRPNSSASFIDLRYNTPLAETNLCDVPATLGDFGFSGANRISPGNAEQSVLLLRMQTEGPLRMPPLASILAHNSATEQVAEWINMINRCN